MKNFKSFFAGALIALLIISLTTSVFASQLTKALTAVYKDIKITINGEEITPKDVTGNIVEPFIVDGTTYLPVRAIGEAIGYEVDWDVKTNTVILKDKNPRANALLSVILDAVYDDDYNIVDISNVFFWFDGIWDDESLNLDDFTDMALIKDGKPIENKLTYQGVYDAGFGDINETIFYFSFENENIEPGVYDFTGKYKYVPFEAEVKVIIEELPVGDTPAYPADFYGIKIEYFEDDEAGLIAPSICFCFYGIQDVLYTADLTDLKLTLAGKEIKFELHDIDGKAGRELVYSGRYTLIDTFFYFYFENALTADGTYKMTGNYMGEPFAFEATIP